MIEITLTNDADVDDLAFDCFMARVGNIIREVTDGLDHTHFCDVDWRALWDDLEDDATDRDICSFLAETDHIFAAMCKLANVEIDV